MAKETATNRAITPTYETRLGTAKDRQGREWTIRAVSGGTLHLTRGNSTQSASRDGLLSQGWTFHFDKSEVE